MRFLNTVYVTEHRAKIARSKGSLIVTSADGKRRVPLEGVDAVTLIGGAEMTIDAMAACAERQIRVACLRRSGSVRFTVVGPRSGNIHLRVAQHRISADPASSLAIARLVVGAKLQNSRRVILRWAADADGPASDALRRRAALIGERIGRTSSAPTADYLRGIEGDAARAHFAAMRAVLVGTGLSFVERNRRPPRDPVNALLGFAYGMLVTEIAGACEAVGLDHQAGFLHRARSGRPSLALDLAEELRPVTDRLVVTLFRRREMIVDHFTKTPGGATYLSDDGRGVFIRLWERHKSETIEHLLLGRAVDRWTLPSIQGTLLARHLRGDLPCYPPFVLAR